MTWLMMLLMIIGILNMSPMTPEEKITKDNHKRIDQIEQQIKDRVDDSRHINHNHK